MLVVTSTTENVQILRVRNTTDREQELWMEPLGDRVLLAPNVLYEIAVTDALEEIDFSPDGFVIFGWVKRITTTDDDGNGITVWDDSPKK